MDYVNRRQQHHDWCYSCQAVRCPDCCNYEEPCPLVRGKGEHHKRTGRICLRGVSICAWVRRAHFHVFQWLFPLPSMRSSWKEALISTDDAGDAIKDLQTKDQSSGGVWKSHWTCTKSPTVSPYDIDSTAMAECWCSAPARVEIDGYMNACGNALRRDFVYPRGYYYINRYLW